MSRLPRAAAFVRSGRILLVAGVCVVAFAAAQLALRSQPPTYSVGDGALLEVYTLHAAHGTLEVGPYSRFGWNHPGPLYFYALAPGYLLSGAREDSLLVTVLVINLVALAALLWTARRYGGPMLACALIVWLAVFYFRPSGAWGWDFGDLLSSSWNPHVTIVPFGLLVVLAAALGAGHLEVLPAVVLAASFVAQTHVAFVPMAAIVVALGGAMYALGHLPARYGAGGDGLVSAGRAAPRPEPAVVPIRRWRPLVIGLDVLAGIYAALAAWVLLFGGFSLTVAGLRISANALGRLVLVAVVLALIRHAVSRRHPLLVRARPRLERLAKTTSRDRPGGWIGVAPLPPNARRLLWMSVAVGVVLWLPPIIEQLTHWPGNVVEIARSLGSGSAFDPKAALAAFSYEFSGVLQRSLRVAAGGAVFTSHTLDLSAVVLAALELVALAVTAVWASRRERRFLASLALVCLVAALASAWAMARVKGDLVDHLAFWIAMLGVLALATISSALLEWLMSRRSSGDLWIARRAGLMSDLFVATLAVYGAVHLAARHQQVRFSEERATVAALARMARTDLADRGLAGRPLRIDPTPEVWSTAAGVLLELYKDGTPLTVPREWVSLFGPPLAPDDRQQPAATLVLATTRRSVQLTADPAYRFIGGRNRVYLFITTN